jgi:transposase
MSTAVPTDAKSADPSVLVQALSEENAQLKRQLAWFKQQLFGSKSEKRVIENPDQPLLAGLMGEPVAPLPPTDKQKITYERGKAKKNRDDDCVTDSGLRFGPEVPVKTITLEAPELSGPDADQYEIIGYKTSHRLAQHHSAYEVLRFQRPVLKRKECGTLTTTPAAFNVLDNSIADVSFLAGMLVDKFLYHLPLYRQHQRLKSCGIELSRGTLTNLSKRSIELLRPIAEAQLAHILQSQVLSMDETPIRAGPTKNKKGKGVMKQGWFWPLMGDQDEIAFTYASGRGRAHIEQILENLFTGTLVSDGYTAYSSYAAKNEQITHANCWAHGRRKFVEAEEDEPELVQQVLDSIGHLYRVEAQIKASRLVDEKKRNFRLTHSKPIVDQLFAWFDQQRQRPELLPGSPFSKAIAYMQNREHALRVFLEDPAVPIDNNHTERALRVVPMGRKNWMFCWTELGAEHVGIIQSLIATCKMQDIDPATYLVDVLQRVAIHPASKVEELTPRVWKALFAQSPLRSDLYHEH